MVAPRRLPPLNALRALEALRETGSVTGAADRLRVSHSAVSHQIKQLDAWIGRPVVLRRGRTVVLSEIGESLARVVNESFDAIRHELDLLPLRARRSVSVSALPIVAEELILPRIPAFTAANPGIGLHLSLAQTDRPQATPPDIEILFRERSRLLPDEVAFLPGTAVPVAAPPLVAAAGGDRAAALAAGPLISDEDSRMWPRWRALAEPGTPVAEASQIHLEGSYLLLKAALGGLGVALCRTALIGERLRDGSLQRLSAVEMDENWTYTIRVASARGADPEVQLVAEWLGTLAARPAAGMPR